MLETISAIASVALFEIILSIDNALVNASLAEELPLSQRIHAIYAGVSLGAVLRICTIVVASFIFKNFYIKAVGGFYLCYLAYAHLAMTPKEEGGFRKHPHFIKVIFQIAAADLFFSIDNIIGAFGISSNIHIIIFGVLIGIAAMLVITRFTLFLIGRFPSLKRAAYILIAFVGVTLLLELFFNIQLSELVRFAIIFFMLAGAIVYDMTRYRKARR